MCISTETKCEYSLATLNGHTNLLARHNGRDIYRTSALQDYQMQMMLLEQQNKKRLLMARQQDDTGGGHPSQPPLNNTPSQSTISSDNQSQVSLIGGGYPSHSPLNYAPPQNPAANDYQSQLRSMEEENKKRLSIARQVSESH